MNIASRKGRLWLLLPAFLSVIADMTITLLGQPAAYWQGSYHVVNEWNPIARWFLTIHPLMFLVYFILDAAIFILLVFIFPEILAKMLSAFYTLSSANSVYLWLAWPFHKSIWVSNIPLVIASILLIYAFEKASHSLSDLRAVGKAK
jgi:hypothetical protein